MKFLEQPAREGRAEISRIVKEAVKKKVPMGKALLMAGMWLQRKSMELVPLATGILRASAFTSLERGE